MPGKVHISYLEALKHGERYSSCFSMLTTRKMVRLKNGTTSGHKPKKGTLVVFIAPGARKNVPLIH